MNVLHYLVKKYSPIFCLIFYSFTLLSAQTKSEILPQSHMPIDTKETLSILNHWKTQLQTQNISPNTPLEALDPPDIIIENFSNVLNIYQADQEKSHFKNFFDVSLLANLYLSVNMYDFATKTYEMALLLKPNDRETLERLATLEFILHDTLTPNGRNYFEKLLSIYPHDLNISNDYAAQLYESNQHVDALGIWENMLKYNFKDPATLDPDDVSYYEAIVKNISQVKERINNPLKQRIITVTLTSDLVLDHEKYPSAILYLYASTPENGIILIKQVAVPKQFPITLELSSEDLDSNNNAESNNSDTTANEHIPNIADVEQLTVEAYISLGGTLPSKESNPLTFADVLKESDQSILPQQDVSNDYHSHAKQLDKNTHSVTLDLHGAH